VQQQRGTNFAYLGFNMEDPVVGQLPVRQAIAHAIDREAIIRFVMGGAARPASAILTPDHWAGNPDLDGLSYDPARAIALLRQAGYGPENPVRIVYKTSSDPFRVRLATILQEQLGRVGIEVDLRSYDWGTFYADIKAGRFQMYSLAWVGIKMPDIFKYALHSTSVPPTGANRGRFLSKVADRLMDDAENADSLSKQADYYRQLQKFLLEELPYVPLWYEDHIFASRDDIVGYSLDKDGNYDGLTDVRRESTQP
jgi:peptide/nickel transport system substrate-binding protein